jgi:hypothetical protein
MPERSMSNHNQQHQQEQAPQGAVQPKAPVAAPKPGLAAAQAIQGAGEPAAAQMAQIIRAHPDERDDIHMWLQQNRGNAFAQQVMQHLGQVEQAMPAGVDLQSVSASIMIPGHKKLGGDGWTYAASTREATSIHAEVSTKGVQVWVQPGLYLDITFPGRDCQLEGASFDFATGKAHASVIDGGGVGVIPLKGTVAGKVTGMIEQAVSGTKLTSHTYDPTKDPDLQGTLNRVMIGFTKLFQTTGDAAPAKAPVKPEEMSRVSAGATVSMKAGANFIKDGTGLQISPGAPLTIGVEGAGDLAHVMGGHDAQSTIDAINIQSVHLSTDGLTVVSGGKPVAKLGGITLARGGAITIDSMTPLGKLADAEAMEGGLSLLVALIAARGGDGNTAGGALRNAQNPVVVDGVSRAMIQQTFTDQIHKMVLQYRNAVQGVDLARSLGIG